MVSTSLSRTSRNDMHIMKEVDVAAKVDIIKRMASIEFFYFKEVYRKIYAAIKWSKKYSHNSEITVTHKVNELYNIASTTDSWSSIASTKRNQPIQFYSIFLLRKEKQLSDFWWRKMRPHFRGGLGYSEWPDLMDPIRPLANGRIVRWSGDQMMFDKIEMQVKFTKAAIPSNTCV